VAEPSFGPPLILIILGVLESLREGDIPELISKGWKLGETRVFHKMAVFLKKCDFKGEKPNFKCKKR
jgi:hypothetical protein